MITHVRAADNGQLVRLPYRYCRGCESWKPEGGTHFFDVDGVTFELQTCSFECSQRLMPEWSATLSPQAAVPFRAAIIPDVLVAPDDGPRSVPAQVAYIGGRYQVVWKHEGDACWWIAGTDYATAAEAEEVAAELRVGRWPQRVGCLTDAAPAAVS